jgi:hypothetical protein
VKDRVSLSLIATKNIVKRMLSPLRFNSSSQKKPNSSLLISTANVQFQKNILTYLKDHLFKASKYSRNSIFDKQSLVNPADTTKCNKLHKSSFIDEDSSFIWKWSFLSLASLIGVVFIVLIISLSIKIW